MSPTVLVKNTGQKESKKFSQKVVAMIGKTHKFSGKHSTSFVPDYHHAVDTMGDSEGFGSSARTDTEMTASEDSFAPKRKCINLNVDDCDAFGIPLQVISVSGMPQLERKELKRRLRAELEQLRIIQKKITSQFTNGVAMPSSLEPLSGQAKKRAPPGQRGGPNLKRGRSGRFVSAKQRAPSSSTSHVMLMKQCEVLLKQLMSHQFGWVFNTPVDIEKWNIPDYLTVIKHPMDLGTVKNKLFTGEYSSPLGFLADVRLTFSNATTYNPPGSEVNYMATTLGKYFEVRWKSIEKKLPVTNYESIPIPAESGVIRKVEDIEPLPPVKKRKISSADKVKLEPLRPIMTAEEKHNLSRDLESMTELPMHIIDFLRNRSFNASQIGEDEIEVDIDDLSDETLLSLRKLVDDHLQAKQANQAKAEPCEMEILNESGLSNSSMQPCKDNDPIDDDVDIGGNEPPVSSYPPVEIEKDTARRSSKCSSSSTSSSNSASSSSDSGSSSGSESNGIKASSPVNRIKETLGSGEALDQKRNDLVDPHDGNQSVSGLDQVEQTSQPRPLSVEADSRLEGESAPSDRQVSPQKLYRAALLRRRFADTILKAIEKTHNQGEKGDPEKLQRKKEELERQQREERARLQAEAKAVEDARRQAEAEAAAEAKRKRELEREAARLALQKMERTVEINENCKFLEDLEMLRAAPAEHLPSSVDEMSPDHSDICMGGFKLGGSTNPLEQLGLYMKVDEEDEEEGEPNCIQDHPVSSNAEEGEID